MKKTVILTLIIYQIYPTQDVLAASVDSGKTHVVFGSIVIIVTVLLAVLYAVGIFKYMKYSSFFSSNRKITRNELHDKEGLEHAISKELSNFSLPKEESKATVQVLTEVFKRELSKKVAVVSKKISDGFESIIREKDLKYSAIDEKYKETLSDKKQTESIIKSIAEGLVVLDDKGEIMMLNPAAEKILDVKVREQIGKPLTDSIKSEQFLSLVRKRGKDDENEIELDAGGKETKRVIRSSSAVVEDADGRTIGMVSMLTDVTKQREIDALKSKFVASVSHELRTPITAIRNSISLMLTEDTGSLTEDQKKCIQIADRNLKRLTLLINDILDISKLGAKKVELRIVPSSIKKVINESCNTFEAWAKTKEIAILRKIQEDIPDIKFDPNRITQVISNLLSNSIKFTTKKGTITIEARLRTLKDDEELIVSISDTGIGIAKENMSKLFSQFQQFGEPISTEAGGTGLGLYISKELVELHGGKIWVKNEQGKGAKFTFMIPAK